MAYSFDIDGQIPHARMRTSDGQLVLIGWVNVPPFVHGAIAEAFMASPGIGQPRFTDLSPPALQYFLGLSANLKDEQRQQPSLGRAAYRDRPAQLIRDDSGSITLDIA